MNDLGQLLAMVSNLSPQQDQQAPQQQDWLKWLVNAKTGGNATTPGTSNMSGLGQGIFSMMGKGGAAGGGGMLGGL